MDSTYKRTTTRENFYSSVFRWVQPITKQLHGKLLFECLPMGSTYNKTITRETFIVSPYLLVLPNSQLPEMFSSIKKVIVRKQEMKIKDYEVFVSPSKYPSSLASIIQLRRSKVILMGKREKDSFDFFFLWLSAIECRKL
ncbi:hypothetical protein HAX54_005382 [Datura stramonium]|uniref:Uncharacterized protein n=1 Tax=Datura stramonium TaxID=4076 RepID=A0ABS8TA28_DATST|nr:hypothetical protein [Datura stramonium]